MTNTGNTFPRFSHANCAHPRTPAGRAACRAEMRGTAPKADWRVPGALAFYGAGKTEWTILMVEAGKIVLESAKGAKKTISTDDDKLTMAPN